MTKIIFYITVFILLCISKMQAQDSNQKGEQAKKTFESEVKIISTKIENITKEEKSALKIEVEAVNVALENGEITKEEAETKKQKLAETRAKNIEDRVAKEQENLKNLVQQKVDGQITGLDTIKKPTKLILKWEKGDKDFVKESKPEKRTTSQFVLAFGANNLVTNKAVANSDFYYWQSHFFEWGFTENTRIFKNHNLLHLKYGFSVMYNNIRPTDNRYFVSAPNSQTNLEVFPYELEDSSFKNVYLVAPLHLEFDFSGNKSNYGNSSFSSHKGVRFGIGGYGGFRIKSKQKMYYNIDEDKVRIKTKGDFNTNDFIYGLSTYLGYKETSLYLKYDLNPLFKNNAVDQNNISLGVRFDFN
ncbi:hypothetical protein FNW25_11535 [Flavobacterium franklandianum]|uniref:Outer membrane protein beta-barrel domain-containing protein n=1 Tax=Flavobacterium franklandianum TaxID=2594430 RepID=A0A553CQI5_9FLAO|nr:hypothetical protein [Flavobacterium franklandianum]TRX22806.1 hypothetical protein FNW17_03295 [Flavobacterium franklandianum]TRX24377.1 hypothetical protein FNW25_11535 [Flavobacterium franklandianum]